MASDFHYCSSLSPLALKMHKTQEKSEKRESSVSLSHWISLHVSCWKAAESLSMQIFGIWKVAPISLVPLSQTALKIQLGTTA